MQPHSPRPPLIPKPNTSKQIAGRRRPNPQPPQRRRKSNRNNPKHRPTSGSPSPNPETSSNTHRSQLPALRPRRSGHHYGPNGNRRPPSVNTNLHPLQAETHPSERCGRAAGVRLLFWQRAQGWAITGHGLNEREWAKAGEHRAEADRRDAADEPWRSDR